VTDPLQSAAYATFRKFGRIGASYPVYFKRPGGYEAVPAEELLRPENLRGYFTRAINEWSDRPTEEDQRAAASRFLRRYAGSIVGASLISLSGGVALDVALPRVQLLIRADLTLGSVVDLAGATAYVSPARPTAWPIEAVSVASAEELRRRAYQSLFRDHLVPAIDRVHSAIGVSWKLIWTTVAESIEYMYEHGRPYFDDAGWAPIAEDRAVIHLAGMVPGIEGANPMKGLIEWEDFGDPEIPGPVQLRRVCCVNYIVPGRGSRASDPTSGYCRSCGLLSAEQRHRLWRRYLTGHREETACRWPPLG
jgi:ferric iron reductase protein FhuF